jgi:hypothetical protein
VERAGAETIKRLSMKRCGSTFIAPMSLLRKRYGGLFVRRFDALVERRGHRAPASLPNAGSMPQGSADCALRYRWLLGEGHAG